MNQNSICVIQIHQQIKVTIDQEFKFVSLPSAYSITYLNVVFFGDRNLLSIASEKYKNLNNLIIVTVHSKKTGDPTLLLLRSLVFKNNVRGNSHRWTASKHTVWSGKSQEIIVIRLFRLVHDQCEPLSCIHKNLEL